MKVRKLHFSIKGDVYIYLMLVNPVLKNFNKINQKMLHFGHYIIQQNLAHQQTPVLYRKRKKGGEKQPTNYVDQNEWPAVTTLAKYK